SFKPISWATRRSGRRTRRSWVTVPTSGPTSRSSSACPRRRSGRRRSSSTRTTSGPCSKTTRRSWRRCKARGTRHISMAGRTIAVLGMHRSGTSCLVGLLEQAGVFLGDVSRKNPSNAKGNRENARIMALHEDLLKVNDGTWDAPPEAVSWPRDLKARRDEIVQSYPDSPLWGVKDPRTLPTLQSWPETLPPPHPPAIFPPPPPPAPA